MSTQDQSPPYEPSPERANGTYRASAEQVHVAVLRDELWSPECSDERGWVVPLADKNYIGQVTCETCLYDVLYRQSEQGAQTAAPSSSETPHAKGPDRP